MRWYNNMRWASQNNQWYKMCMYGKYGVCGCCMLHKRKPKELKLKAAASPGEAGVCLQVKREKHNEWVPAYVANQIPGPGVLSYQIARLAQPPAKQQPPPDLTVKHQQGSLQFAYMYFCMYSIWYILLLWQVMLISIPFNISQWQIWFDPQTILTKHFSVVYRSIRCT